MDSSGISKHESENRIKLHIPHLYPWFTESEPEILGVCPINVYLNNKNNIIFFNALKFENHCIKTITMRRPESLRNSMCRLSVSYELI